MTDGGAATSDGHSIVIDGLVKHYGRKVAVDGLSISVKAGEIFSFLGPNGAGKTTTIKVMAGLLRPTAGSVAIAGHDIVKEPEAAKSRMAFVPDEPYLYDKLTGREFLRFVAELYGIDRAHAEKRIDELSRKFDFASYMDELCEGYSHGMSQRVVIGSALVHDPDVLLIDEPFVGLDPRSSRVLKDTFRELAADGRTVFLSTHTLAVAEEVAHRICIINHGKMIVCGTREEVGAKERDLEEVFLELTADDGSPGKELSP